MPIESTLLLLLGQALASDSGIIVITNNPARLRTKLYNIRKDLPEFSHLKFEVSRTEPTISLWIVKPVETLDV